MLNRLKMLGAMGSIFGNMFGMGMGGAVNLSAHGAREGGSGNRCKSFSAKEYARRKTRQKMARESRRRNRKVV